MVNAKLTLKWTVDGNVSTDVWKQSDAWNVLKCPTQVHNFATDDEVSK